MPQDKFNIVIMGDKTKEYARKLLSLHTKKSTCLVEPVVGEERA